MTKAISGFAIVMGGLLGSGTALEVQSIPLLSKVDHLVYATPDLNLAVERLDRLLGVKATMGGQHPGRGTRNALIALGPGAYLEIIGPDPDQPNPDGGRPFGIDTLKEPRLVTWAAKGRDLPTLARQAARAGIMLGPITAGSRRRPDGLLLSWQYTDPRTVVADGIVPFFIDWGTSPHPAGSAAAGAELVGLRALHSDPVRVQKMLAALEVDLPVSSGPAAAIVATINTPRGRIELR